MTDIWNARREQLEATLVSVALELAAHTGAAAFSLPVAGTTPPLLVSLAAVETRDVAQARALWEVALGYAAFYVNDHCIDGAQHAETIMGMSRPTFLEATAEANDDARNAARYRHIRDTAHNGYHLAGATGIGNWHLTRKREEGIAEFFFGERLDAKVDADILAAEAAILAGPQP